MQAFTKPVEHESKFIGDLCPDTKQYCDCISKT